MEKGSVKKKSTKKKPNTHELIEEITRRKEEPRKNQEKREKEEAIQNKQELKRWREYWEKVKYGAAFGCGVGAMEGDLCRATVGAAVGAVGAMAHDAVFDNKGRNQVERTKADYFADKTKCGAATGCAVGMVLGGPVLAALGGYGGAGAGMMYATNAEVAAKEKATKEKATKEKAAYNLLTWEEKENLKDDKFYKEFWAKSGGVRKKKKTRRAKRKFKRKSIKRIRKKKKTRRAKRKFKRKSIKR